MSSAESAVKVQVSVGTSTSPVCCPLPSMSLWNMHPRVYLEFDKENRAVCPYCGTTYLLEDDE